MECQELKVRLPQIEKSIGSIALEILYSDIKSSKFDFGILHFAYETFGNGIVAVCVH
jgi:hypothetical protein